MFNKTWNFKLFSYVKYGLIILKMNQNIVFLKTCIKFKEINGHTVIYNRPNLLVEIGKGYKF